DGRPIVWPAPTHGAPKSPAVVAGGLAPWPVAADIIDWSLPCPSIFLSREEGRAIGVKRPLVEPTMARIAKGVWRYVIDCAEPFMGPVKSWGGGGNDPRSIDEPLRTTTASKRGEHAVVTPFVAPITHTRDGFRGRDMRQPLPAVTGAHRGELALIAPHLTKF